MTEPHIAFHSHPATSPSSNPFASSGKDEVGESDAVSWEWAQFPPQDQKEDIASRVSSLSLSSSIFPSSHPFDEEKKGEVEGEGHGGEERKRGG